MPTSPCRMPLETDSVCKLEIQHPRTAARHRVENRLTQQPPDCLASFQAAYRSRWHLGTWPSRGLPPSAQRTYKHHTEPPLLLTHGATDAYGTSPQGVTQSRLGFAGCQHRTSRRLACGWGTERILVTPARASAPSPFANFARENLRRGYDPKVSTGVLVGHRTCRDPG